MAQVSAHFRRAMNHSLSLLAAGVIMILAWSYFRIPDGNLLMVIFSFLSTSVLYDVDGWQNRLKLALLMALYAATLQFLIGICWQSKFLLVILPAAFAYFTLRSFDNRAASCCALLVGYIGCYADGGFVPSMNRVIGIFIAVGAVMLATALVGLVHQRRNYSAAFGRPYSPLEALRIALALGFGTFIANALRLPQAPWVMLSVIFIYMAVTDKPNHAFFAMRRVYGVPFGLFLGGMFMSNLVFFDYRFVYLTPFIGALGFFVLYYFGSYFFFTVLFMVAFSIYVDWATGDMQAFHIRQLILARSLATVIGGGLVLLFEFGFLPGGKTETGKENAA